MATTSLDDLTGLLAEVFPFHELVPRHLYLPRTVFERVPLGEFTTAGGHTFLLVALVPEAPIKGGTGKMFEFGPLL